MPINPTTTCSRACGEGELMGFWRKAFGIPEPVESRTILADGIPWSDSLTPFNMVGDLTDGNRVSSNRALSLASVYAANRLLAQSISTLPLKGYRRASSGEERLPMGALP